MNELTAGQRKRMPRLAGKASASARWFRERDPRELVELVRLQRIATGFEATITREGRHYLAQAAEGIERLVQQLKGRQRARLIKGLARATEEHHGERVVR